MRNRAPANTDEENNDDYRRKRRRPPPNSAFASILVKAREAADLSQVAVARKAKISPRTVAQVEKEGSARADVIIRLAIALRQPAESWLRDSGHEVEKVDEDRIKKIRNELQAGSEQSQFLRRDPTSQFNRMLERVKKYDGAIMCSFINSQVSLHRPENRELFVQMFDAGLHLALVCPFPIAARNIALERARLSEYYGAAYKWTTDLAKELRKAVPDYADQITVFSPKFQENAILVVPPIRVSEVRPAVIKYGAPGNPLAEYEVGAYLHFLDGRDDQWIEIYDGENPSSDRAKEAFGVWSDYCDDIIKNWDPSRKPYFDTGKLQFWEKTPDQAT